MRSGVIGAISVTAIVIGAANAASISIRYWTRAASRPGGKCRLDADIGAGVDDEMTRPDGAGAVCLFFASTIAFWHSLGVKTRKMNAMASGTPRVRNSRTSLIVLHIS